MFARRPETGEAIWAYQYNPHDLYDHDSINEHLVLDLQINGQMRKVLVHPERNGNMYVIDRQTGEVLSAEPFAYTNTSDGVDLKTGRLKPVEAKEPPGRQSDSRTSARRSPAQRTGSRPRTRRKQVSSTSRTRISVRTWKALEVSYIEGTPYVGANVKMYAGPGGNRGSSALGIRSTRRKSGR